MPRLVTIEECAVIHGKSTRTVERWVAQGKVRTATQDGRTLIVDDEGKEPLSSLADTSAKLSEVTQANAVLRSRDADIMSVVVSEMKSARRWCRLVSATMVILGVAGGVIYHRTGIRHVRQVVGLQHDIDTLAAQRDQAVRRSDDLAEMMDQERVEQVETVSALQADLDRATQEHDLLTETISTQAAQIEVLNIQLAATFYTHALSRTPAGTSENRVLARSDDLHEQGVYVGPP